MYIDTAIVLYIHNWGSPGVQPAKERMREGRAWPNIVHQAKKSLYQGVLSLSNLTNHCRYSLVSRQFQAPLGSPYERFVLKCWGIVVSYEEIIGVYHYFSSPFPLAGPDKFTKRYNLQCCWFFTICCSRFEIVGKERILVWSSCGTKAEIF